MLQLLIDRLRSRISLSDWVGVILEVISNCLNFWEASSSEAFNEARLHSTDSAESTSSGSLRIAARFELGLMKCLLLVVVDAVLDTAAVVEAAAAAVACKEWTEGGRRGIGSMGMTFTMDFPFPFPLLEVATGG